ncbi:MAG: TonB-dependent receptor [Bryobacteraceae bacterium]
MLHRAVLALLVTSAAFSQTTTATLAGTVRDSSQRPIGNAAIEALDLDRNAPRTARSAADGSWRIAELRPARYRVTVSAPDLQPAVFDEVVLTLDSHRRIEATLAPAARRESVTVSAPLEGIDAESPALGATLERDRIAQLPLNRRDFLQLSFLTPGVLPPVQDSELSSRGSFAMHAGGAREEFNNFTLDGADNNDPYTNRYVLQPSLESIQEFRILTNSYSAEYGRSGGAQVNVVTRSGSNDLHGTAYEYLRNRLLDARNFFDGASRPKYVRNQFGGSLGGPVHRDRSFFFVNYEALRERHTLTHLAAVPTAAERVGEFTRTVLDPFTRQPFPGNRVPAARVNPLAPRVLALFDLPASPVLRDGVHSLTARYDHRLSSRDELSVRYGWGSQNLLEPFAEEVTDVAGFGNYVDNSGHNGAVQHQRVWTPAFVQTTRFAYTRSYRRARPQNWQTDVGTLWGVNWLNVRPRDFGFPSIKIAGYSQVGDVDQLPLERTTPTWQIQESVAWIRGAHSWKLGGEFRHVATDGYLDYFGRGSLTFSGALTGVGLADVLLGLPSFGIQSKFDNRQSLRTRGQYLYAQDDWRVTPRLNLSLGVRYEYASPSTDPEDRMYTLDVTTNKLVQVGRNGVPRAGLRPDRNNFAPRVGFAWTPGAGWVVRGGYGVFFDSGMFVVNSSFYFNPPLFNVRVFFPTATSLLTLANPFPTNGGITPPPSPNTLSPDITTAYMQNWNFTVERQVSRSATLTLAYAGSKGTHLIRSRDLNQPAPAAGVLALRRPNPAFGGVFFSESGGNSNFHSLQANLNRRLTRGWSLIASYTWSKSIDDTSAFLGTKPDKNFPQDSRNFRAERAQSSFDLRHRLAAASVWQWKGVEFRTILAAQTGQPFTPLLRFDNSNTGNSGSIFGNDRPDLLRNPRLSTRTPERWFDTAAFAIPRQFTFGSAGRNIVAGPGLVNLDAGVARTFRVHERWRLTLEAQAFNLSNTAHFDLPERYADEPSTFGRIFSAKSPRQVQLGLRIGF